MCRNISAQVAISNESIEKIQAYGNQRFSIHTKFFKAAQENNLEIFQSLLLIHKFPSQHLINLTDSETISVEILRAFLQHTPISEQERGRAAINLARIGRKDLIELLLNNGSISKSDQWQAALFSVAKGHIATTTLLDQGRPIPAEFRNKMGIRKQGMDDYVYYTSTVSSTDFIKVRPDNIQHVKNYLGII